MARYVFVSAAILVFASFLCGCMSIGTQVKSDQLSGFRKGETTKQEVMAKLGKPTSVVTNSDGSKVFQYI